MTRRRWTEATGRQSLRSFCQNRKCQDPIYGEPGSRSPKLCPACRYIGRRAFGRGAFVIGVLASLPACAA